MDRFDSDGVLRELEKCPRCGTTSLNCPLYDDEECPYDTPDDDSVALDEEGRA